MYKNTKKIIILIISLLIIVLIPILIDWLIIGNKIPSNISNSEWISFLGGYVGSIVGGIATLIGIVITIRYNKKENKKDRELQVRPYCSIRQLDRNKLIGTEKIFGFLPIGREPNTEGSIVYQSSIYIKNIGLGPAIEFEFNAEEIYNEKESCPIELYNTRDIQNRTIDLLQSDEEGVIQVYICFPPIAEEIRDKEGVSKYTLCSKLLSKYRPFDVKLTFSYCDMFLNKFKQTIFLGCNISLEYSQDGKAYYVCDIHQK